MVKCPRLCLGRETAVVDFGRTGTAQVTMNLLTSAVIISKREHSPSLRRVESRSPRSTAVAVSEDPRSRKKCSIERIQLKG